MGIHENTILGGKRTVSDKTVEEEETEYSIVLYGEIKFWKYT